MIEVRSISKSFGTHQVLKNVNVSFEPGKVNFIIGRSGQGKSVLAKCIVGLMEVDQGQVMFDERNFTMMDRWERKDVRKDIGMLFQGSALFDSMTVEENVMFPLRMFSKVPVSEMRERASHCLKRVNLEGKNKLYPSELSGGMKKRTGIARAIAMNPKYLFIDEPNSGLDPQTSIVIDNLVREITNEYNVITVVISHDMNSVMEIGDRINFIYNGEIWWKGDKKEILNTDNQELNNFVFPSRFMQEIREGLRQMK
ncbi:MAG: ATP-binding cassette domain-containing protein [Crocinitomicaceae bacterium]|nr:ATP-binding cassette domain-containing protein [Crocinitomicaceae bacterium]